MPVVVLRKRDVHGRCVMKDDDDTVLPMTIQTTLADFAERSEKAKPNRYTPPPFPAREKSVSWRLPIGKQNI